jgi:hypothetical protein
MHSTKQFEGIKDQREDPARREDLPVWMKIILIVDLT